ncbi:SH3 domain-containing protein [Capilliphycus salinus ALCB114379]|uniref:SH3 domain-containing protein n=1 Tax=Capilliphycus salinus TaxID=2768948 RepID=UPI0039A5A1AF
MKLTTKPFLIAVAIAPTIASFIQITPHANAQSLYVNCSAEIIGNQRGSQVNIRSGAGTRSQVIDSVSVGNHVIILNDGDRSGGPLPLRQVDTQGKSWYMITKTREGKPDGLVPATDRGWIREDFLQLSCPP